MSCPARPTRISPRSTVICIAYLYRQFGPQNAEIYVVSLDNCFEWLAQRPVRGKPVGYLRSGYLRFEYAGHTIWYMPLEHGVRIMRVLPGRLVPERRI